MFDAVRERAAFMQMAPKVLDLMIEAMKEACDNSMCRAEGGFDKVEEIREELETYRRYKYLLRVMESSRVKPAMTCKIDDVTDFVTTEMSDKGYCDVTINGANWRVQK